MSEAKPRYTVELTTEGWQIKDNETGQIGAGTYGSRALAISAAHCENSNWETEQPENR